MSSSKSKLLLLGTGFVGGTVLHALVDEGKYDITASTRKDSHAAKLKDIGCNVLQASMDDSDKLEKAAYENDIIINTSSSDHPGSVDATLKGIRRRSAEGKRTIYIHTSGTGVLDDACGGEKKSDTIYSDATPDQVEALDDDQPHRLIDKKIARTADELKDTASIRVILPPLIYGDGTGPFNQLSMQTPAAIRASLKVGYPVMHGLGKSVWSNVHVQDLAAGYMTLLHALEENKLPAKSAYDIYVFCESGSEHSWRELAEAYGAKLHQRGLVKSAEPKSSPEDQLIPLGFVIPGKQLGINHDYHTLGGNSRSRATKLRELGWSPKKSSIYDSLDHDIDVIQSEQK